MRYHYVASQAGGKMIEGDLDAGSPNQVLEWMAGQGYKPISIKSLTIESQKGWKSSFGQKITLTDKVFLTKYLALMLKVGTDLFKAIDILISDFDKPVMKSFLVEVRENLSQGKPFYSTFAKYPQYFSSVIVNLIRAGEKSGNLDGVFFNVSNSLEKDQDLQNRVKGALIYPVILIVVSMLVLLLMVLFVLPKIANVFSQTSIQPPLFSRIVFSVGLFMGKFAGIIFPLFIGSLIFGFYFFFKNRLGITVRDRILNKTPVIKDIFQHLAIQRFAATFSSLLRAGLPILEAIEITANAVGNDDLKAALMRIANEGIAKGMTVGEAFRREPFFPKVVTNLMAISEKAGHMEDVLETLAQFYASEVDSSVKIMVSFLEPVLLLSLGLSVGVIALAVIVPVYQLVSNI
ncbi:MAG: type II secretion system F family protein [Candidatus Colwellbacteria bacterium]|nr:type II secretion system F family protein [Candidatus Colwellbacteria bacterium]